MGRIIETPQGAQILGDLELTGEIKTSASGITTPGGYKVLSAMAQTLTATEKGQVRANMDIRTVVVPISCTLVSTGDVDTDIGTGTVPADFVTSGWKFTGRAWVVAGVVVGTMAASVLTLRTATAGGGTAITAALTCTGVTAAGKCLDFTTATLTDTFTAAVIVCRQTTDSANAGACMVFAEIAKIT